VGIGVESIGRHFIEYCYGADPLTVNYRGGAYDWANITIDGDNSFLFNAVINYYYSDSDIGYDGEGCYNNKITVFDGESSEEVWVKITEDNGTELYPNVDGTLHGSAAGSAGSAGVWMIDPDVDCTVEDFGTVLLIMRNYCTCDSIYACLALEQMSLYVMTGENTEMSQSHKIEQMASCWEPYYVNGQQYIYFYYDLAENGLSGNINGFSFEPGGFLDGRRDFDIVSVGLYSDVEVAETIAKEYILGLGQ
jgi:hypothetical protein